MKKLYILFVLFLLGSFGLFAQNKSVKSENLTKSYTVAKIEGEEIKIDGDFNESAWKNAVSAGDFFQFSPNNGNQPSQKTFFKILYDDNNLYVAVEAYDNQPEKIDRRLTRRDNMQGDIVGIQIDSYFDKQTAFVFAVNAAGVKIDGIVAADNNNNFDVTPDPVWYVKTNLSENGWNAEMKIPLSQIRFADLQNQTWGFEIIRIIYRSDEFLTWGFITNEGTGWVSKFNLLNGISNIKPKKQANVSPYIMSSYSIYKPEQGNPFADGKDIGFNAGIDGKIAVTNDFTLDFAVNPDFGQVEADPSEVNLSAYETFLQEKRSFFVEGSNITDFNITPGGSPWSRDVLFYSRRIGRSPHYTPELVEGEYMKMPKNTKILGAAKFSGKSKNGLSVGIIETVADREFAEIDFLGERRNINVEPFTNYFTARVQKDFNKGNTVLGGIVTSAYRDIDQDYLSDIISHSETAGLDFSQYFKNKKYYFHFKIAGSKISGTQNAILQQQLSPARYFQRPDADYLQVDSTLTTLLGHAGNIMFGKQAHKGFQFGFDIMWRSPGLELNDLGYMRQGDIIFQFLWLNYKITEPFSIFRSMGFESNQWSGFDFGGKNLFNGANIVAWTQFKNYMNIFVFANYGTKNTDNTMLWGGPAVKIPSDYNSGFGFSSNQTKKFVYGFNFSFAGVSENHSNSQNFSADISYRPFNNISFAFIPTFSHYYNNLQYIDQIEFEDNMRYVMSSMNQKTVSLTLRIDFNISPDFTIQYYGSPFISSGLFSNYKHITNPADEIYADRFEEYSQSEITFLEQDQVFAVNEAGLPEYFIGLPDFNYKQFRSNLVLRWEFLPGSLLYLVWAQDRTDAVSDGSFDYFKNMGELFKISPSDVLMLKLSYRINI